ncbi:S-layer homology domain-containing protein [Egicoccus sp. AB-alg2]|uniref:S-layer homology domain-containing protein n=1 Tax=Egicoccus sp. AB-alg2 TaxID=3242693 RepID=UPI00359DA35A
MRAVVGGGLIIAMTAPAAAATETAAAAATEAFTVTAACPADVVPASGFTDIRGAHRAAIECLRWFGLTEGVTATTFVPGKAITRGQAASFVVRLLRAADDVRLPAPRRGAFRDVSTGEHAAAIETLAAVRTPILRGFDDGTFRPKRAIRRDQFATIVARTLDEVVRQTGAARLPAVDDHPFVDVRGEEHRVAIARLTAAGIVAGTTPTTFAPGDKVTRGQSASMLARTLGGLVDAGVVARPVRVRGVVHDAADAAPGEVGKPIRGATVTITHPSLTPGVTVLTVARTNSEGRFALWLRHGEYRITVAADGYLALQRNVTVERDTAPTLDLRMFKPGATPDTSIVTTSRPGDVSVSADGRWWLVALYKGPSRTRFLPSDATAIVLERPDGKRFDLGPAGTEHAWFSRNPDGTSTRVGAQTGVHRLYYRLADGWVHLDARFDDRGRLTAINGQPYRD